MPTMWESKDPETVAAVARGEAAATQSVQRAIASLTEIVESDKILSVPMFDTSESPTGARIWHSPRPTMINSLARLRELQARKSKKRSRR